MVINVTKADKNAKLPIRSTEWAAGWDLFAASKEQLDGNLIRYQTGLAMEIPEGYVGLLFPRSSVFKTDLSLTNCVGVLDADYRGTISFIYRQNGHSSENNYNVGDRIGQIVVVKHERMNFIEVPELSPTKRGTGGYGSTGR